MAARLIRKTFGGSVYELDDPYSQASMDRAAFSGSRHLRLTPGQESVLTAARALLEKSSRNPNRSSRP